jgi:hypothetical protein
MTQPPRSAEPPTSPVQLRSDGYVAFRITTHDFVRYEYVDPSQLRGEARTSTRKPMALIYRCRETGAERRWGLE